MCLDVRSIGELERFDIFQSINDPAHYFQITRSLFQPAPPLKSARAYRPPPRKRQLREVLHAFRFDRSGRTVTCCRRNSCAICYTRCVVIHAFSLVRRRPHGRC